ncbi:MAG TPA: BlaI/MecI/CopY family transcriptional regulator [Bacteroidia bacterium]|nr:BlaI/MecI/CopY family transcriptional regulator [Bacteroidia bacterium]
MKRSPQISPSEWKVMEVVWEDPPVTAQQVSEALGEQENWKPQTVKTLLARLVKKGVLDYESEGRRFHYNPAVGREEAVVAETESFLDRISRGSLVPALQHLVQTTRPLGSEEIEALRELLKREGGKR